MLTGILEEDEEKNSENEIDILIKNMFEGDRPHINKIIESILSKKIKRESTIELNLDVLIAYSSCINVSKEFEKLNRYYADINRKKAEEYLIKYSDSLIGKKYN